MAWRSQGITGSNNIPLGSRRRFGDDEAPPADDGFAPDRNRGRSRSPVAQKSKNSARSMSPFSRSSLLTSHPAADFDVDAFRKRRKKNRWGNAQENKAAGLMGLTTAITAAMTAEQLEAYTLNLRIEEISQKLRINDVVPADADR